MSARRRHYVADSETDPFEFGTVPEPFIWGLYSVDPKTNIEEYHEFDTTAEFVAFVRELPIVVYAHNGGKFDWHFLLMELAPFTELMVISGRVAKFQIGRAEFRDSFNILPVPLGKYKKDDFDYDKMRREVRHLHMAEIRQYLKNDCRYLFELVDRFIQDYGSHLTLAGAAFKQWQKIAGVKPPKTTKYYYNGGDGAFPGMYQYYYGGRTECFKSGIIDTPFKVIDINSAYPAAMMQWHPYGGKPLVGDTLPGEPHEIAKSFVSLDCVSRGALPWREPGTGQLIFPRDDIPRLYHITGHEYLAAMETGALESVAIQDVVTFDAEINFREYVEHFYALKEAAGKEDEAGYLLAKLFLNSLYGKFAANPAKYKEHMIVDWRMIEGAEDDGYDFAGEVSRWALMSRPIPDDKARYYDVAVAASITGWVRAFMWRSMAKCQGLIYCDTDSIAAESFQGLDLHPTRLGAWDLEAECDRGAVAGKKLYAFHKATGGWKTASKGVRLTPEQIIRVARGQIVQYQQDAPTFSVRSNPRFVSREVALNARIM